MNGKRLVRRVVGEVFLSKAKEIGRAVTDAAAPEIGYDTGEELRGDIKEAVKGVVKRVGDLETKVVRDSSGVEIPIYDGSLPQPYQGMAQAIPKPGVFKAGETLDSQIRAYATRIHADAAVKTSELGGKVTVDFYQLLKPQK